MKTEYLPLLVAFVIIAVFAYVNRIGNGFIQTGRVKYHALTLKKLGWLLIFSAPLTFIFEWIEKYVYSDWDYLFSLGILIMLDTLLGLIKAWKTKTLSSQGFGTLIIKILTYASSLIVCHVFASFTINGVHGSLLNWVDNFIMTSLIVREGISIFENISAIQPGVIPLWLLKRLEQFNSETGEFEGKNP